MVVPSEQLRMAIAKDMVEVVVITPSLDASDMWNRAANVKATLQKRSCCVFLFQTFCVLLLWCLDEYPGGNVEEVLSLKKEEGDPVLVEEEGLKEGSWVPTDG
jgi:hypothetical protein